MPRTCPDCGVALVEVDYSSATFGDGVRIDDPREDGTGPFGGKTSRRVLPPGCGLVRFYAL